MRHRIRCPIGFALLVLVLASPAGAAELLVGVAASLQEVATGVARDFEAANPGTRVQLATGASNVLAAQARAGAPMDAFVSADAQSPDGLVAEGLVAPGTRTVVARNRIAVVAAADLAAPLAKAEDLAGAGIRRIALPGAAVPAGHYGREWLERKGLLAALEPKLVTTEHVRAALAAVDAGNADAAIVYVTDARVARSARVAFVPPESEQPAIEYVAVRLAAAKEPALADAFLRMLRGTQGRRALEAAGFGLPPTTDPEP